MAGYERIIWNGDAGTSWTNDTGKIQYQLFCDWSNTCGVCAQYDHAIGPAWPLPYHRNCRCRQEIVKPDEQARPFVDFREIADSLPDAQKRALVGASNYKLIKEGVVGWDDVVTPYRVRTLREVTAIKNLEIKQITDAGVRKSIAQTAYAAVHTPEHELVAQARKDLEQKLKGAGMGREQIARMGGEGLASRISIKQGPSGQQTMKTTQPDADRLRAFLAGFDPRARRKPPPKPKEAQPPETPEQRADREAREFDWSTVTDESLPAYQDQAARLLAERRVNLVEVGSQLPQPLTARAVKANLDLALQRMVDGAELYRAIPNDKLKLVLRSGRFKSQFEIGTSEGAFDPGERADVEERCFANPQNLDPRKRAIYGYLAAPDFGDFGQSHHSLVMGYALGPNGEPGASVRFKPRARFRSTFTVADSLNHADDVQGSRLTQADTKSIPVGRLDRSEFKVMATGGSDGPADLQTLQERHGYVELQVHGGLPISDIRDILFEEAPDAELQTLLSRAGIPWRVHQPNP